MIQFKNGRPIYPVLREDLIEECLRLRGVIALAVEELARVCPPAAEMVKDALFREKEYAQPNVGWERGAATRKNHFYDDPVNAGKEMP